MIRSIILNCSCDGMEALNGIKQRGKAVSEKTMVDVWESSL